MAIRKVWLCIVCTPDQGLYKIKVEDAWDEANAKMIAHNIVVDKFKPKGIDTIIAKEWTTESVTDVSIIH